jgi:hypothetical protein
MVGRLPKTSDHKLVQAAIPKTQTHVLIREERVREKPDDQAARERKLAPGTLVRVVQIVGSWVVVAREGQKLGYLPADALARTQ